MCFAVNWSLFHNLNTALFQTLLTPEVQGNQLDKPPAILVDRSWVYTLHICVNVVSVLMRNKFDLIWFGFQRGIRACHLVAIPEAAILVPSYPCQIVPFHKSQDTLLHPGLNDQIQNTLFTEDPHVTRALWGWFDWLPGSACAATLIGQRWSTISASTRYPRLNPLWLVTHCTLSHAHHSFQSHMYHLACMEIAKFLVCNI